MNKPPERAEWEEEFSRIRRIPLDKLCAGDWDDLHKAVTRALDAREAAAWSTAIHLYDHASHKDLRNLMLSEYIKLCRKHDAAKRQEGGS
jgi:hypothetical protein